MAKALRRLYYRIAYRVPRQVRFIGWIDFREWPVQVYRPFGFAYRTWDYHLSTGRPVLTKEKKVVWFREEASRD